MTTKEKKVKTHAYRSRRATVLPVTFLMLFVSLMLMITTTYYVAMARITAKGQTLNFSIAKQSMASLESNIESILWSPGSSFVYKIGALGGRLRIDAEGRFLTLNVTDGSFNDVLYQGPVGEATYELAYAEPGTSGSYLRGSSAAIVNSSSTSTAQLRMATGYAGQEIRLSYRPFASCTQTGMVDGKPVNALRIYIVNMNASQSLTASGAFNLKAVCINVECSTVRYNFTYPISSIQAKAAFGDDASSTVTLPVSGSADGAIVDVELVICTIRLQKVG